MKTGSYEELLNDLETCSKGAPCADCKQPKKWNCDWMLMERAKKAVEELLTMHRLDQGEIVRLRRQIEVLQMDEYEKLADLREGSREPYKK